MPEPIAAAWTDVVPVFVQGTPDIRSVAKSMKGKKEARAAHERERNDEESRDVRLDEAGQRTDEEWDNEKEVCQIDDEVQLVLAPQVPSPFVH